MGLNRETLESWIETQLPGCKDVWVDARTEMDDRQVRINPNVWNRGLDQYLYHRDGIVGLTELRRVSKAIDDDPLPAFVTVMAWGSGTTNGRGPRYTRQAIAAPNTDEHLRWSADMVRAGRVGDAYEGLMRAHKIPGVGPAFFTKWLWLVGLVASPEPQPRPLILDARVWDTLNNQLEWSSKVEAGSNRWGPRYEAYLNACAALASQVSVEPDVIEWALWYRKT